MPKILTIGHGNREGCDRTAPAVRDAAYAQDARLRTAGAFVGIAGDRIGQLRSDRRRC